MKKKKADLMAKQVHRGWQRASETRTVLVKKVTETSFVISDMTFPNHVDLEFSVNTALVLHGESVNCKIPHYPKLADALKSYFGKSVFFTFHNRGAGIRDLCCSPASKIPEVQTFCAGWLTHSIEYHRLNKDR